MDLSDEEIIRRAQRGERSAFLTLFDRHYPRVESYARRQTRDAELARDLASETFLRAYRNLDKFRTGENITYLGYLLMICRRLIITESARRRAAPARSLEECERLDRIEDDGALPVDYVLGAERRAMLQQALRSLSEEDREIIHLAFERDLSR